MTATRRKFPWRKACFVLLILIAAAVTYDYQKNNSHMVSKAEKFLKNSGLSAYGQKTWSVVKFYSSKGLEYLQSTSPEYYKATVDFCTPYAKLAGDMFLITRNLSVQIYNNTLTYVKKNGPVVLEIIDHYAPGILEQIQAQSIKALNFAKSYSAVASEYIFEQSSAIIRWLEKNVFVGKLSPENLQNYAMQAIDTTQTVASQTFDWVYEKVQTLSKVP